MCFYSVFVLNSSVFIHSVFFCPFCIFGCVVLLCVVLLCFWLCFFFAVNTRFVGWKCMAATSNLRLKGISFFNGNILLFKHVQNDRRGHINKCQRSSQGTWFSIAAQYKGQDF